MRSLYIDINFLFDQGMRQPMNHTTFTNHSEANILIFIMLQCVKFNKLVKLLFAY